MVALKNPDQPDVVGNPGVAVITLQDNSATPALSINHANIIEGNSATLTVTLGPVTGRTVTVNYSTADGVYDERQRLSTCFRNAHFQSRCDYSDNRGPVTRGYD
jgi:hypothetical protein